MNGENVEAVDITMADVRDVQEVVDRHKLALLCQSFFELFGVPVRLMGTQNSVVAEAHEQQNLCRYVNGYDGGRQACQVTIAGVREYEPAGDWGVRDCFTGARYLVRPVQCQQRVVARLIFGPFWPAEIAQVPESLQEVDGHIHLPTAESHRASMTRAAEAALQSIADHAVLVLEALIQNSHRAMLASQMQIESTREYYRELVKKSEHLESANQKLKEVDSLKMNFLATVSHELRTPLTSIIGYAEMLKSRLGETIPADAAEFLKTIHLKADQLLRLISDLLDVSKLDADAKGVHPTPVDPASLIADVSAAMVPQANKKNLQLKLTVANGLPNAMVDAERFKQVLLNLVDNAIKFTEDSGEIELAVERSSLEPASAGTAGAFFAPTAKPALTFIVRDSGIGIPLEAQHRIYDAFYQVDNGATRRYGGTGLGLSIAKRLVDAHKGKIEVQSAPGEGSVFRVTVPASV